MKLEELLNNNPNNFEYLYKILLRDIKSLDDKLTKYLVQDFFEYEETKEENVITEIKNINDVTNYILLKLKENDEDNGEEYRNYLDGSMKKMILRTNNQFNAWRQMLIITEKLKEKIKTQNISIGFCKGYSFGFGLSNYCSIKIDYVEIEEHCHHHKQIIGITTTNGEKFEIYKNEEYYKTAKLDLENYRKNIDRHISCDNPKEVIEETTKLIEELFNRIGE